MYTEDQAKQRWCPMSGWNPGIGFNLHDVGGCHGSRCMAWQWLPAPVPRFIKCANREADVEPITRPANVPASYSFMPAGAVDWEDAAGWLEPEAEAAARRTGFCGLARSRDR